MKISVLQWNVLFHEKADNILEFIRETNADIVCLQELTQTSADNPKRDIPAEIARIGYNPSYAVTVGKPGWIMGNGLFSKFPIKSSREVFLRRETEGDPGLSNESRAYLECKLDVDGHQLIVGTAHLSFTPGFTFMPEKEIESDSFIETVKAHKSAFVFTGDFNALPNSRLISELDKIFKHAGPAYTVPTWTTKPFDYLDFKADGLNWRLDYVYVTPDIKVLSSKTLKTDYSDHLPILTEIEFSS